MSEPSRRLAIVLSGGGARGAYEVGVLSYVFDEFLRQRKKPILVDLVCGTSVGAINSAFLSGSLEDPVTGMRRLVSIWEGLELDRVLGFGWKQAAMLPRLFRTGAATGLVDVSPMARLIGRDVPWREIGVNLRRGRLQALSITCTEVFTGRTVLFMQTGPTTGLPSHAPPRTLIVSERIGPQHVLASASIPLLFPPVRVGRQLYMDGGIRQNTPIAPAIRLGATHVLVVGTSRSLRGVTPEATRTEPTTAFVLGKIMNALLLDHLEADLGQVALVNDLIESGKLAYGEDFVSDLNRAAASRGGRVVQPVETLIVRPSVALGALGAEYLQNHTIRTRSQLARRILEWLDSGTEADLASYLLFDGGFARQLIELGRADARAQRAHIAEFFAALDGREPDPSLGRDPTLSFMPPAVG